MESILNVIFGITALIGVILTTYYGRKASKLKKQLKKIEWVDLQLAVNKLCSKIKKEFHPEVILTPAPRGGIIAFFLNQDIGGNVPIFSGICQWKYSGKFEGNLSKYEIIETEKWRVYIPNAIFDNPDKRILIVDDFVMTGDLLRKMRKILEKNGIEKNNIKTFTLVTTKVAIENRTSPDYYYMETDSVDFYFPWGKTKYE